MKLRNIFIFVAGAVIAEAHTLFMAGCASAPLDHDVFPDPAHCSAARGEAIRWYVGKYHTQPQCPPCRVTHEAKPMAGMGGWTTGNGIHIWVGQLRDETHEWRHWLAIHNGKGGSEEAVR